MSGKGQVLSGIDLSAGWRDIASVMVVGARGMLGTELVETLEGSAWRQEGKNRTIHAVDLPEIDITDEQSVRRCLEASRPQVVINCAAYTDVDGCEAQREKAFAVNARGPGYLAQACAKGGGKLVHISTDFVFDGALDRPYRPGDEPRPQSVYGASKRAGEENVQRNLPEHLIVRTSWLFGRHGKNFVATIAQAARQRVYLEIVDDQVGSPTYAVDLAAALVHLIGARGQGIYHFCNAGHCSWYEFGVAIVRQYGIDIGVRAIRSEQLQRPAKRPCWSVLDIGAYTKLTGQTVRPWQDALADYINQSGK